MFNIMSHLTFTRTLGSAVMLGIMLFLSLPAATYALVPPPTLSLTANPVQVGTGGTATLSWTSQNTTSCTASGGWSGSKGTSGSQTVDNITSTRTYNLTCAGPTKNISASVKVWVVSPPPPPPVQPGVKPLSGVNGMMHMGVDPVKAVDAMKDAGFNSMRQAFHWKVVEKKKGVLTWSPLLLRWKRAVDLQQDLGMKPLVVLSFGNGALYPGTGKSQAFINGFTRYAKWLATELKGSVNRFEVWNEWNGGLGLPCTYQDPKDICTGKAYVKLLCPVYAALKQVDPSIVVVGGATAGLDNRFIDDLIKNGGAKCLDVLSLHMYRYNNTFEPAEVTLSKLHSLQDRIKPIVGKEIPFYITETGVTVYPGGEHTLDAQADYLTRFHLAAKAYPFIKGIWTFSLTDLNASNPAQSSFGLMQGDFTPKPAYYAMQDVTGLFTKSKYLGKIPSISDIWLLKFREQSGSYTYAVWSTGASTRTKLIFDAPVAGKLNIQEVGSNPIVITKASFKSGSNAINVAVSSTPRIIWASGANIDITEAAK